MSDVDNVRRDPPADWRDKLIAVLTADGITELPKVAKSKSFLVGFGKIFGWILVAGPLLGGEPDHRSTYFFLSDFQTCPFYAFDFYMGKALAAVSILAWIGIYWFVFPRMKRAGRALTQVRFGNRPTQVLRHAKHPPVLFLRSFNFDSISSSVPTWR